MTRPLHLERVNRAKIWAACYRVTGCAADADEVLQEAYTRAVEAAPTASDDQPLDPWLMKVAMRLAIDRLRRRRELPYDGPWLPSPIEAERAENEPGARYEIVESATFAFLFALEALTPAQRAVLVLRDVVDLSVAEVAHIVEETEEAVRALHHRARGKLATFDKTRVNNDATARDRARVALESLFGCLVAGDMKGALALLADDARLVNDAGGVYPAARKVVEGPDRIIRFYLGLLKKLSLPSEVRRMEFNGLPAMELFYGANHKYAPHLVTGVILDANGRVATVYTVLAPRKLAHLSR
jgi:RNA polymerase sigma-70 factor (ECF subfamily)